LSTEQQLAAVVSAANNLTGVVTGKIGEIDRALEVAQQTYREQLASLNQRLPRLAITKNFTMVPDANGNLVDGWDVHQQVTTTKLRSIVATSQSAGRPQADVDFMREVQADVREQFPDFEIHAADFWRNPIHVWQMKWSDNLGSPWLAFPHSIDAARPSGGGTLLLNSMLTMGAFVRVVEGEIRGTWATGAESGKWRWCSLAIQPAGVFGQYMIMHPERVSVGGTVEVMLAGACTGVVTNPADWSCMLALG
jgi:sulfur carrier protein ThiS